MQGKHPPHFWLDDYVTSTRFQDLQVAREREQEEKAQEEGRGAGINV